MQEVNQIEQIKQKRELKTVIRVGLYMIVEKRYGRVRHEPDMISLLSSDVNEDNIINISLDAIESYRQLALIKLKEYQIKNKSKVKEVIKAWLDLRPVTIDLNDPTYEAFMLGTNKKYSIK